MKDEEKLNININPVTTPILYTDMFFINVNEDGVSLDVCQKMGATAQYQVVARIGMSREHAKKFVQKLSEIMALTTAHAKTGEEN
jgi:hypothetical protein